MFIWSSLTMTDTIICQNMNFSSWITLYVSSNLTPNFYCLHHFKRSVRVQDCLFHFVNMLLYLRWVFGSFSPNPQAGRPLLVVCPRLPERHCIVIQLYKLCLCNGLSRVSQWSRDWVFKCLFLASCFEEARWQVFLEITSLSPCHCRSAIVSYSPSSSHYSFYWNKLAKCGNSASTAYEVLSRNVLRVVP